MVQFLLIVLAQLGAPASQSVTKDLTRYTTGIERNTGDARALLYANDIVTGTVLWQATIFSRSRSFDGDPVLADLAITHLSLQGDTLLAENQRGQRFVIDLKTRAARPVVTPPQKDPDDP